MTDFGGGGVTMPGDGATVTPLERRGSKKEYVTERNSYPHTETSVSIRNKITTIASSVDLQRSVLQGIDDAKIHVDRRILNNEPWAFSYDRQEYLRQVDYKTYIGRMPDGFKANAPGRTEFW